MFKKTILTSIRFYQRTAFIRGFVARMFFMNGHACRFTPTCSVYAYEAVEKYGAFRGSFMGLKRILRCNPFFPGGHDPVP